MGKLDLLEMPEVGRLLRRGGSVQGELYATDIAEKLLHVRWRDGTIGPLCANPTQRMFEQRRGRQNIVLKARQMGITTWMSGRLFLKTVTGRGVLSVQVAHTREAAEAIFGIVQRMWENLEFFLVDGRVLI